MDCKMALVKDFEVGLVTDFTGEQIANITQRLLLALEEYDVSKKCTDLVPYDSVNERILKQYCACLFVDGKSEKTIYQYKRTCIRLAEAVQKDFTDIGVYDIRFFLASEKSRGVSDRSAENMRANLSAFFQWMTKEDIIAKNPCLNIKPIKYADVVRKPFSSVEIDALRGACKTKKERAIVEVLLSTGIRVSELAEMKIGDIDRSQLSVHVLHGKGDKERMTYITHVALKHLTAYWNERAENGDYVFYNNAHKPLCAGGIRHILNNIGKRAGVDNVHPHRFRRTFASGLATRGMDVQDIKTLLGHSNIDTTMEYVYTSAEKAKASYCKYVA